jgi:hypothetical protein
MTVNETALSELLEALGEVEEKQEPHGSLYLTNGRREEAVRLAHVLCEPMDLTKMSLSRRVRNQAERMWRRFGRDIDIEIDVKPDGFIDIRGDLRHAAAYIEEIIP